MELTEISHMADRNKKMIKPLCKKFWKFFFFNFKHQLIIWARCSTFRYSNPKRNKNIFLFKNSYKNVHRIFISNRPQLQTIHEQGNGCTNSGIYMWVLLPAKTGMILIDSWVKGARKTKSCVLQFLLHSWTGKLIHSENNQTSSCLCGERWTS